MSHNPFAKARPNAKRAKPRRTGDRVRLRGEQMTDLRHQAFERSGGFCECDEIDCSSRGHDYRTQRLCFTRITWETMELSHIAHGPRKTDTLDGVLASCKECHRERHNSKAVPRKAGRRMNQTEALAYWNGDVCFCGGMKGKRWSFCFDCLQKLSPQLRDDLEKVIGKDYLETMSEAERELLAWKPAEEQTA